MTHLNPYTQSYMANEFKLLVDELKYKLTIAFNRINKLELQLQDSMVLVSQLKEKLYLGESIKQSTANKEERKTNGKS